MAFFHLRTGEISSKNGDRKKLAAILQLLYNLETANAVHLIKYNSRIILSVFVHLAQLAWSTHDIPR